MTVRIRDAWAGQETVTCVIPDYEQDGEELVAEELRVDNLPRRVGGGSARSRRSWLTQTSIAPRFLERGGVERCLDRSERALVQAALERPIGCADGVPQGLGSAEEPGCLDPFGASS